MTVQDTQLLKQLRTRKQKLEVDVTAHKQTMQEASAIYTKAVADLKAVNKQIQEMTVANKNKGVVVTEHALLRYIERVMGLDLEQIKKDMVDARTTGLIKTLGDGKYPIIDGFYIVVKDNSVISVV